MDCFYSVLRQAVYISLATILFFSVTLTASEKNGSSDKTPAKETCKALAKLGAIQNPLSNTKLPDLVHSSKDYFGVGDELLSDYYDAISKNYIIPEEVIFYPMFWPRETNWKINGEEWQLDFPKGIKRNKEDLYFVNQRRRPGDARHYFEAYRPLNQESDLKTEVSRHIKFVFETYRKRHLVAEDEISQFIEDEKALSPHRTAYFVYVNPSTHETAAVLRLFDGSSTPVAFAGPKGEVQSNAGDSRLPIERTFPNLVLPERKTGEPIYELGRLAKDPNVIDPIIPLCRTVTDHLFYKNGFLGDADSKGVIYIDATAPMAKLYKEKYGFEIFANPKSLGIPSEKDQIYVLKISVKKFMELYSISPHHFPVIPKE